MFNVSNDTTKHKKSKVTLDRIQSIKRNIMETLNLFKNSKQSPCVQGSRTLPQDKEKMVNRKHQNNCTDITQIPSQILSQGNQLYYNQECPYAALQRNLTWPHDDYSLQSLQKLIIDKSHLNKTATVKEGTFVGKNHKQNAHLDTNQTKSDAAVPAVKNQKIQTDAVTNVNADIIMYLNQFNDKVAFGMYPPTDSRNSYGYTAGHYENDYRWQNDSNSYYDNQSNRRVPRLRDHGNNSFMYWPHYDHLPLACFESERQNRYQMTNDPQKHNNFRSPYGPQNQTGFYMSGESQRQNWIGIANGFQNYGLPNLQNHQVFGMPKQPQRHHVFLLPNESPRYQKNGLPVEAQKYNGSVILNERQKNFEHGLPIASPQINTESELPKNITATSSENTRAPSRVAGRVSSADDSGSILSSETDSDFIFYPCSSLSQSFQRVTLMDSRSTNFLSPPLDMPENINTNFSWRSDFYGSSLDEVTLQFYLDDDALSDDVFVDDYELYSANTAANDSQERNNDKQAGQYYKGSSNIYNTIQQNDLDYLRDETELENYSDNCYAYRYADIDEVLGSLSELEEPGINQKDENKLISETDNVKYIPLSSDQDIQCSYDDSYLAPGHDLSNVFDSLRRNSTQTKARKMWRQRRTKCKKNNANNSNYNAGDDGLKKSMCSPSIFTFDSITEHNPNSNKPPGKPLRGILKNRNSNTSKLRLPEMQCTLKATEKSLDIPNNTGVSNMLETNAECRPHISTHTLDQNLLSGVNLRISDTVNNCINSVLQEQQKGIRHSNDKALEHDVASTDDSAAVEITYCQKDCTNVPNLQKKELKEKNQTQETSKNTNKQLKLVSLLSGATGQVLKARNHSLDSYDLELLKKRQWRSDMKARNHSATEVF